LVDDKLKNKIITRAYGPAVPKLIWIITQQAQMKNIHEMEKPWQGFVIKPARGSGDKDILVSPLIKTVFTLSPLGRSLVKRVLNGTLEMHWRVCFRWVVKMKWP
jgi:hypothetical protein